MPDLSQLWGGPAFDLSVELGPIGQADLAVRALKALWAAPRVAGPWSERSKVGIAPPDRRAPLDGCGQITLDDGVTVGFFVSAISEKDAYDGSPSTEQVRFHGGFGEGADWLTIGVPFPMFGASSNDAWGLSIGSPHVQALCDAYVEIADAIFLTAPFRCAVIGEEASGCWRSPTPRRIALAVPDHGPDAVLTSEIIESRGGFFLSPALWAEIGAHVEPVKLRSGLLYVPPRPDVPLYGA